MSGEQSDEVAQGLMKGAREDLEARQKQVAERKRGYPAAFWSIVPASAAAAVTALTMNYLALPSSIYAVVVGAVAGWIVGSLMRAQD